MSSQFCVGFENSGGAAGILNIVFVHASFTESSLQTFVTELRTKLLGEYVHTKSIDHFENVLQFLRDHYRLEVSFDSNIRDICENREMLNNLFDDWFNVENDEVDLIFSLVSNLDDHPSVSFSEEGSSEKMAELFKLAKVLY